MKKAIVLGFLMMSYLPSLLAAEGLVSVKSAFSVEETANRMEQVLTNQGMTIFNRINHSASAVKVGVELRDTVLLMFGNPKVGSPLMQCQQTVAIDLPQKALIWQDETAAVWVSYNQLEYLQTRHAMEGCEENIIKITKALDSIVQKSIK